jgi:hypothetical protein
MFGELIKACERCIVALPSPPPFYYVFYNPCSCKEDADAQGGGGEPIFRVVSTDIYGRFGMYRSISRRLL